MRQSCDVEGNACTDPLRHATRIDILSLNGRLDALDEQLGRHDINTIRIYLRQSSPDVMQDSM